MLNAQKSHGNAHGKLSPQALIENPDGVRDSSPGSFEPLGKRRKEFVLPERDEGRIATERAGASESTAKRDHPGYRIPINKLDPKGLARALSPSALTAPQNQQPKQSYTKLNKLKQRFGPRGGRWASIFHSLNFSIQGVSRRSKLFQAFFRKKRLFIFPGRASSRGGRTARCFTPILPLPPLQNSGFAVRYPSESNRI